MIGYPLLLDLSGKRVVVVGAGTVATRRTAALVEAGAKVTVIAPTGSAALAALDVDWQRREYTDGDLIGAWLVHAATDDTEVNAAVAADAQGAGVWCVRADDAAESAAWVPAVAREGDVTLAVNAGRNPRLAVAVRDRLGELLPQIAADSASAARRVD
ncbi:MAG: NAD(P)-dependent oxidoreductase [Mycobacteriales bacterium]